MNIAYCSLLLPEEKKLSERTKKRLVGISVHKVTKAEIEGIDANLEEPVTIFNIINTLNYPHFPSLIFKTEKWSHTRSASDVHIGYINLFGIKYITQTHNLYKQLNAWVKSKKKEKCVICVHESYYPAMKAAYKLKKKYKEQVVLCLNAGDIPGKTYGVYGSKKTLKQKLIEKFVCEKIMEMAKGFDCFVFVTKNMAEAYGVQDKPFVVVECVYSEPEYALEKNVNLKEEDNTKVIFYAGAIREDYGIGHLLRAFSSIKNQNYRLVIAGGGAAEALVEEYAQKDSRIKFMGFIPPQEVYRQQQNATVLISPRLSNLEFVKYSFPSKSVDSLASGKPYIAHKLPCDPEEYADYIQYAGDESDEGLKNKIVEVCELPEEVRAEIGQRARQFIIEEKTPKKMTKEIVSLWLHMCEES